MRTWLAILIALVLPTLVYSQGNWQHGRLTVTPCGHYLQYEDGTPFFWLGDTAFDNQGQFEVTTPTQGFGNDWVLVIDHPDYRYPIPNFQKMVTRLN